MSSELKSNEAADLDEQLTSTSPTQQENELLPVVEENTGSQAPDSKKNKKLK